MANLPPAALGRVIPSKPTWQGRFLAQCVWCVVQGIGVTVRWRWTATESKYAFDEGEKAIFVIWHNRLALSPLMYRRRFEKRFPGRRVAGLVSASRDGGLMARIMELFGIEPIRGSSSRRGAQALRELVAAAKDGCDLVITPDGPRGPRYVIQPGVIAAAQLSGRPIVPVSYHLTWKYRLASWDQFQIPMPFTRIEVALGQPLWVPESAGESEREDLRQELQRRMVALTRD